MLPTGTYVQRFSMSVLVVSLLSSLTIWGQDPTAPKPGSVHPASEQLRIPNRLPAPLFQGEQGTQKTEIHYDPATGLVTLKLLVQDPNGYFIPNIRRDNFVVYEDGVRQNNATVEIEHAAVSVALLIEHGGRFPGLNRALTLEISGAAHQLMDTLGPKDRIAVWAYGNTPKQLADFSSSKETLEYLITTLKPPDVSETNLYDALVLTLNHMRATRGRKAIVLISSGVDTFSKATYEDAVTAARNSDTPMYGIDLGRVVREAAQLRGTAAVLAGIDWKDAEKKLLAIAKASGGRLYSPESTIDLSAIYDDMMENLKVRYVITYKSSSAKPPNATRAVRVELVDPKTNQPLRIVDANGRPVSAKVIVQDTYTPAAAQRSSIQ